MAIVDFSMPGMNGIDLTRYTRDHAPQTRVVGTSGYFESALEIAERFLAAGAEGFLPKPVSVDDCIQAARVVLRGEFYLAPGIGPAEDLTELKIRVRRKRAAPQRLSPKEHEVLALWGRGWTVKAIAEHLRKTPSTVEKQIRDAQVRLGLKGRASVCRWLDLSR